MNKIGIIGIGTVGSALLHWFKKKEDTKIYLYDKYKNIGSLRGIKKAEIIFICVPTPYKEKEGYDLSYLDEAISYIEGEKVVIIKSTVLPGTTEKFQENFKVSGNEMKVSSKFCRLYWKCPKCSRVNRGNFLVCEGESLRIEIPCKRDNTENLTINFKCSSCNSEFKFWLKLEEEK